MCRSLLSLFLITIVLLPHNAYALFGEEAWLSGENALLTQILVEEKIRNTSFATEFLPRAIQSVNIANATLATTRDAYRLYKTVRDYTTEQLLADVKKGLTNAFPGIIELEEGVNEFSDNIKSLRKNDGGHAFFNKRTQWDTKTSDLLDELTTGYQEKMLFPWLFPHASYLHEYKPAEPERIFIEAMVNSGMDEEIRFESIQRRAITRYAVEYDKQAQQQENLTNQILAKELISLADMRSYLYDLNVSSKMELASQEESKAYWDNFYKERDRRRKEQEKKNGPEQFKGIFDVGIDKKNR